MPTPTIWNKQNTLLARQLHASGNSIAEIASRIGCAESTAREFFDPDYAERRRARDRKRNAANKKVRPVPHHLQSEVRVEIAALYGLVSASRIAVLCGCSKGEIVGIWNRARKQGLLPPKPIVPVRPPISVASVPALKKASKPAKQKVERKHEAQSDPEVASAASVSDAPHALAPMAPAPDLSGRPAVIRPGPQPTFGRVNIFDARPNQCRRPLWEDSDTHRDVCGEHVVPGFSYCEPCCRRLFGTEFMPRFNQHLRELKRTTLKCMA